MKMTNESKQATEPPVAKKQKIKVVNKSQPAVDDAKDLFNHSESSRPKGIVKLPVKSATKVTDSTKPYAKLSADDDIVTEKTTTTSTTTNDYARDAYGTTLTDNKPTATGGGRVIKIKRKKLPVNKENVDTDQSTELQKCFSEPDSVPEPQPEAAQLPL